MTSYRDSLTPAARAVYDEATQRAGQMLAASLADLHHDGLLTERAAA